MTIIKTDKFEQAGALAKFSRLMGLAEKHEQEVLKDPMKYLAKASREISKLRIAIDAAYWKLSGFDELKPPTDLEIVSIASTFEKRNREAKKILQEVLR